jgi:hypothetical protein
LSWSRDERMHPPASPLTLVMEYLCLTELASVIGVHRWRVCAAPRRTCRRLRHNSERWPQALLFVRRKLSVDDPTWVDLVFKWFDLNTSLCIHSCYLEARMS